MTYLPSNVTYNNNSGNIIPAPINLPNNERIIAETVFGSFISLKDNIGLSTFEVVLRNSNSIIFINFYSEA